MQENVDEKDKFDESNQQQGYMQKDFDSKKTDIEDVPLNKLLKTQEGLKKLQEAEDYQGQSASGKKEESVIGGSHEQQEILGQKHYGSLEKTL